MIRIFTHIRSAIGIVFDVVFTLVMSVLVMTAGALNQTRLATSLMRFWSFIVLRVFGISVNCKGSSHLPVSGGGIVVFNHQSHFDIPSLMRSTRKDIRFGAKIELFKIPFFGRAMRKVGTLPIARENRSEVMKIYKEAEARFRENIIFVLAPEGTRQSEPKLGRFKKGPFIFAINAQVPLIPAVIKGAHAVLPKGSRGVNLGALSREIEVEFLPAVSTAGLQPTNAAELMDRVREAMVRVYDSSST